MTAAAGTAGPVVIGLDLSLTATGIAYADGHLAVVKQPSLPHGATVDQRMTRLAAIAAEVRSAVNRCPHTPDLVVVENYAFAAPNGAHSCGELGGIIRFDLWQHDIPVIEATPGTLKRFATGNGRAAKTEMVIAARDRLGYAGVSDNEADAAWARAAGHALLGRPLDGCPPHRVEALRKVFPPVNSPAPQPPQETVA